MQYGLLHDEGAEVRIIRARRQRFRIHLNDTVPGAIDVQIEPEVKEVLVVNSRQRKTLVGAMFFSSASFPKNPRTPTAILSVRQTAVSGNRCSW